MTNKVKAYQAQEETLWGAASSFYHHHRKVIITKNTNPLPIPTATLKKLPANIGVEEAIDEYNQHGDIRGLIHILTKGEVSKIEQLFKHWDSYSQYLRKVTEPDLLEQIYQKMKLPLLAFGIAIFVGRRNVRGYKDQLFQVFISPQNLLTAKQKKRLAYHLKGYKFASLQEVDELLTVLKNPTTPAEHHPWLVEVLVSIDSAYSDIILATLTDYLKGRDYAFENDLDRDILRFIATHGDESHTTYIKYALDEAIRCYEEKHVHYNYGDFFLGYARVKGEEAVPYFMGLLKSFRDIVPEALGIAAAGTQNKKIIKQLVHKAKKGWRINYRYKLTIAARLIMNEPNGWAGTEVLYSDQEQIKAAEKYLQNVGKNDEVLANTLREIGLIPDTISDEKLYDGMEDELFFRVEDKIMYFLTQAGILVHYDAEEGALPIDYVARIQDFAASSHGRFAPVAFKQSNQSRRAYKVIYCLGDAQVEFYPEHNADWVDVSGLSAAVNLALMHQGSQAYFVELDTGGQDVMHIFATPEQVHKLTELFDIKHQGY